MNDRTGKIQDVHRYTLKLCGRLEPDFTAAFCPPGTTLQVEDASAVLANICSDQAGLIGLIRRLHNLGCLILSLSIDPEDL